MPLEYIPGQRWVSDTELEMGLGTIMKVDHRTVSVLFRSTDETRIYAKQSAPLTRVHFSPDDTIKSKDGWSLQVQSTHQENGLNFYSGLRDDGTSAILCETELDHHIRLNRPADRLFLGQLDTDLWFELRLDTHHYFSRMTHSDLRGLTGGRTSLIPHQLYIAHEVSRRYAPRVLLADEVGLGKTIEAGMIIHQQLVTGRAQRVMIVVPETLIHQWLVEMLRRFNLHFSIFDEGRCTAMEESLSEEEKKDFNPFHNEQLVICSLGFLMRHPNRASQAEHGEWDLLIVDEAHHLRWSPDNPGPEYLLVEKLASSTAGVLLLTATPEQLGKESHYARLRLLDQDRFHSLEQFLTEEQNYAPIADAIDDLIQGKTLRPESISLLRSTFDEGDNQKYLELLQHPESDKEALKHAYARLIDHLLDRHGTGRVLFRNTRNSVKGFPERKLIPHPLHKPVEYGEASLQAHTDIDLGICPERLYELHRDKDTPPWIQIDPRIDWLANTLKALKSEKVLVIAAKAETVLELSAALLEKHGIHAAVFHERLSIIERDRAAGYFADHESGTQILICSEIGSEGRNFQFAHHLVLFDLPLNPDLLEQRIGRLDRIGQTETIQIHVPYLLKTAQEVLFHWYSNGLDAFEHTCPAGYNVFTQVKDILSDIISNNETDSSSLESLIDTSRCLNESLNRQLHEGRDRLLEYNSCRPLIAESIYQHAVAEDQQNNLQKYLLNLLDCLGLEIEDHSRNCYIVRPSEGIEEGFFPELKDEGLTYTCDRDTALAHEYFHYFTWDHPMVFNAMEAILNSEKGNSSLCAIKYPECKPGTLLVETLHVLETASSRKHPANRYLPSSTLHAVFDLRGNLYNEISTDYIYRNRQTVDPAIARKVIKAYSDRIKPVIQAADKLAEENSTGILKQAKKDLEQSLQQEIDRLQALSRYNPNVRQEEIQYFEQQKTAISSMLDDASLRLDAIRLLITL